MSEQTSEYKTVKETAQDWGVTKRWVNMCITDGRINGAVKTGNMWLIPRGTPKPKGKLFDNLQYDLPYELSEIIKAAYIPLPCGNPDSILDTIQEKRAKVIIEIALNYWRGNFEKAINLFRAIEEDDAVKLCACPSAIASAVSSGNYGFFAEIETYLKEFVKSDNNDIVTKFAELALSTAYISAMAPQISTIWLKNGDFTALPIEIKFDALYLRAKYFQGIKEYETMLAIAQSALAFMPDDGKIYYSEIILRITCAEACYELNRIEEAKHYLSEAMKVCLPHCFYTPLADGTPLCGGLIEQCLERKFPDYYEAVMNQSKAVIPNWITFHNSFTKEHITNLLSPRDFQIARLVAKGRPYKQIADEFYMSTGTLNNRIQIVYEKLAISGKNRKKELEKYVL